MTDRMKKMVKMPSAAAMTNKAELSVKVSQLIIKQGLVHSSLVLKDVDWFFFRMGISASYFETTRAEDIATHISSIYAGKILAKFGEHNFSIRQESEERSFFVVRSIPGDRSSPSFAVESEIEDMYLLQGYSGKERAKVPVPYRLKVFRTENSISEDSDIKLRFYLLEKPQLPQNIDPDETDLLRISDPAFLKRTLPHTRDMYQSLVEQVVKGDHPVIVSAQSTECADEKSVCIAYRHGTCHSLFSVLSDVYHYHSLFSSKKYVEQFANGVTVICAYVKSVESLRRDQECSQEEFENRVAHVVDNISLLSVLPRTSMTFMFQQSVLNAHEVTWAYCCWKFSHQFLSKYQTEYTALQGSILANDPSSIGHLLKLKHNLRKDTFTESKVSESLLAYPEILRMLCADFEKRFNPEQVDQGELCQLADRDGVIEETIQKAAKSEFDLIVLSSALTFNQHILKTNFFKAGKEAISFRLNPAFLSQDEYPVTPFGIFYIVGGEFRGYHVRFKDIARGGIRLIRSRNVQDFSQTVGRLFDENYNLANTQQSKNKDIPEGGSKGTILLSLSHQDKGEVAFRKYIDALLDLVLPSPSIVDYYGQEEIIFCGPDEGTADFMDWASAHARKRGAGFWKAFTTGKSLALGGIPHDRYGMTTRSVHQYVLGILEKLGLDEESVSKVQTGGPDGDLGSNEILISKDKTTVVVDGSGVLYDPAGINRAELTRLARNRQMVCEFDTSLLSSKGYYVSVEDRDTQLPDGTYVPNGLFFRNAFHLSDYATADVFVPCGGRPEAVDINNVDKLLDGNGEPKFRIVVEGANLFFTQGARLKLEQLGVILYKDASANKGGVTSSSLEVLAALALTDEDFAEHMAVKDESNPPEFYQEYVEQVQAIVELNARKEFECIWNEHASSGIPRSEISDLLSNKINELNEALVSSSLWDNQKLRETIVKRHCPKVLIDRFGLDYVVGNVPDSYLKAIFGSQLASSFVYEYGINPLEFSFFDYMGSHFDL